MGNSSSRKHLNHISNSERSLPKRLEAKIQSRSESHLPKIHNQTESVRASNLKRLFDLKEHHRAHGHPIHASAVVSMQRQSDDFSLNPAVNQYFQNDALESSQIPSIVSKNLLLKRQDQKSRFAYRNQYMTSQEAPNAFVQLRVKTTQEIREIKQVFKSHFLFKNLSEDSVVTVIEKMKHFSTSPRDVIFMQGSVGHYFYVVAGGHVEIVINNRKKGYLGKGKSFGELALLQDSVRSATVRSVDRATLWGIERSDFRQALKTVNSMLFDQNKRFIETVPLLKTLTTMQKDNLCLLYTSPSPRDF